MKKQIIILFFVGLFFVVSVFARRYFHNNPSQKSYPLLAMWWPDTSDSIEKLKKYDWMGLDKWENINRVKELKKANPFQKVFISYSYTETDWDAWQDYPDVMKYVPSEWFLTQRGTELAKKLNSVSTTVYLKNAVDANGKSLFVKDDTITCEYESMKVLEVDIPSKTLKVERGFVRGASSHKKGVRIAPHITFWPKTWVMNMSDLCPKIDVKDGHGPQTWTEYAIKNFKIKNLDLWDGFIIDRMESTQSWLIGDSISCRNIDPDNSNKVVSDDYKVFDESWYRGCENLLKKIRTAMPDKILLANTAGAYHRLLNGTIFEGMPGNWDNSRPVSYDEWYKAMFKLEGVGYIKTSQSGYFPNFTLLETYEDESVPTDESEYDNPVNKPGYVPNYRKMRLGLTSALLGDGYFSYEINTEGHGSLGLLWFDEYDNAGKRRGYLGKPIGAAYKLKSRNDESVWARKYVGGLVVCNPTQYKMKIFLDMPYRLIRGRQAPKINTGKIVSSITIGPHDGRILLKILK